MCIRDSGIAVVFVHRRGAEFAKVHKRDRVEIRQELGLEYICLLYTSDAADDLLCVDLGGRRIIKKNTFHHILHPHFHLLLHH